MMKSAPPPRSSGSPYITSGSGGRRTPLGDAFRDHFDLVRREPGVEQTIKWGCRIVEFRAQATVAAIRRSITQPRRPGR
jgi:hypothetical protein